MYLTRMKLDVNRRSTMLALASPSKFHGAIESSFPGERQRRLWRIDPLRGNTYLMLLSETPPDLSKVFAQFGPSDEDSGWETKNYDSLLQRIEEGSKWRFRLIACPVCSVMSENKEGRSRGKVTAHVTVAQQKEWLLVRAEKNGFLLNENDFEIVQRETKHFKKGAGSNEVTLAAATYEGVLTVTDKEAFGRLLTCGIGRGKAYGLGMMTVVRSA